MAARCVLMMVLLPNAGQREVMATVAGLLAYVPWARPWQVPGGEVLSRHRARLGSALFQDLFTVLARRNADAAAQLRPPPDAGDRPAAGWLGDLLLCSGDGIVTRTADGANREQFGSLGTGDDSSPYPHIRAVVITVCVTRAVLGAAVAACEIGEQTLTRQILTDQPWVFGPGRCYLFDRNFLGATLVEEILKAKAHLLMRMKAGIDLPNLGWLPDGSYRSRLRLPDGRSIPVRVVDYDVVPPGEATTSGELFCLVTDLLDHEAYPADALAAAYPWRWTGSETTFKENKSTITDAGPSRGPILRSRTPDMVRQEFWAWLSATDLTGPRAGPLPPSRSRRPRPARPGAARPGGLVHRDPARNHPIRRPDPHSDQRNACANPTRPTDPARPPPPPRPSHQGPPNVPQRQTRHHDRHRHHRPPGPVGPPRTRRSVSTHPSSLLTREDPGNPRQWNLAPTRSDIRANTLPQPRTHNPNIPTQGTRMPLSDITH
jgi:hypothetical protein